MRGTDCPAEVRAGIVVGMNQRASVVVVLLLCGVLSASARAAVTFETLDDSMVIFAGRETVNVAQITPDGAHVYVGGSQALTAHRVQPTGQLSFVQRIGVPQALGFDGAYDIAITSDGKHVYAPSRASSVIVGYERDPATGELTEVDSVQDGVGGVDGIRVPWGIVASPGGEHLYVAGEGDDAVAAFARDATTGELTFIEAEFDGVAGVTGLQSVQDIALSSDGAHLYTSSFFHDGSIWTGSMAVFSRDPVTGALTFVTAIFDGAGATGLDRAYSVRVSPDGNHVYVANGAALLGFERDPLTGLLTQVETEPFESIWSLSFTPDGSMLYGVGRAGGERAILIIGRDASTGALTPLSSETSGVTGALRVPRTGVVSPDGLRYFLPDRNEVTPNYNHRSVNAYARDPATGALSFVGGMADLLDVVDVVMTSDGEDLYVAAMISDAVGAFSRDAGTGELSMIELEFDGAQGVSGLDGVRDLALSPDDAHLYAVAKDGDALAVFARDEVSGALAYIESHVDGVAGVDGLDDPQFVAVSPDGTSVYVARNRESAVAVFERDPATGVLSFVEAEPAIGPKSVVVSPDSAFVYEAGGRMWSRHPVTGELDLADVFSDAALESLTMSANGEHVYSLHESFSRDAVTGLLTGIDGDSGLVLNLGPKGGGYAFLPDGSHFVVGPFSRDSLFVFKRDPLTGARSFVHATNTGAPCSSAGHYASGDGDVVMSPDGRHTYLACEGGEEILRVFGPATSGCSPTPLAGCRTAARGFLQLKDKTPDKGDKLNWKWSRGLDTTVAEFEPASVADHYSVCVYDFDGIVFDALVPAGQECGKLGKTAECFTTKDPKVLYKNTQRTPEGIKKMKLRAADGGKASFAVSGDRDRMGWIAAPVLPLALPVVAQLQSRDGLCWESTFNGFYRNDTGLFGSKY